MPVDASVTMEEYLRTSYRPDRDFVDGVLEERLWGELEHGLLQAELGYWFIEHGDAWQTQVLGSYRVRVSATRVRVPDVCVVTRGNAERVRVTPPLLCIDILSPEDRFSRTSHVMEDYLAMGVKHLWILDPIQRIAYIYTPAGRIKVEGTRLEVPGTPIYLDLPSLFTCLD